MALGRAGEAVGRPNEAISAYEAALAIEPTDSIAATARAILLLRRAWGNPLPSPPDKHQTINPSGRITMRSLGRNGRFGNQIFQYGYLRLYGHVHRLQVEVPEWIGRWLFDLDDPLPGDLLPRVAENKDLIGPALSKDAPQMLANRDVEGWCQCHTSYFNPHRELFRTLFRPGVRLQPIVDRAMARLKTLGRTLVAVHVRRGDYIGGELFWATPSSWYLEWLREIWQSLEGPLLYVASDDASVYREFADFSPITAQDLDVTIPGAEMYPDFCVLACADILAISNSSFSVTAAMLNEKARSFVRPAPIERRLVPFDPWSTTVLLSSTWRSVPNCNQAGPG
ncbi:MAG TPA: alpha-1,2-fucosyltransferase [Stellaceae bacterium]|nr:alpha-1,2-fucosyltransferase [Stellaceae bacterium]